MVVFAFDQLLGPAVSKCIARETWLIVAFVARCGMVSATLIRDYLLGVIVLFISTGGEGGYAICTCIYGVCQSVVAHCDLSAYYPQAFRYVCLLKLLLAETETRGLHGLLTPKEDASYGIANGFCHWCM